jgi:hypothetical protein
MVVEIRKLGNLTRETAKENVPAKSTAGFHILTQQLQGKQSDQ